MIQRSKLGLKFFSRRFRRHVYLRDLSIVVMRDILQSRYLRRRVAHKQLAQTSLIWRALKKFRVIIKIARLQHIRFGNTSGKSLERQRNRFKASNRIFRPPRQR